VRASEPPQADENEVEKRRDAVLLRALSTPHKRQKEMKVGRLNRGPGKDTALESVAGSLLSKKYGSGCGAVD